MNNIEIDEFEEGTFDMKPNTKRPERTCMACGKKGEKHEFLRFCLSPDLEIVADIKMKMQSRGVYICSDGDCIKKAFKKRVFTRFFKCDSINCSIDIIKDTTFKIADLYFFSILEIAFKAGKLLYGSTSVFDAAEKGEVKLILLTEDAGGSVRDKAHYLSDKDDIKLLEVTSKLELAVKLDRAVVAIMAITDDGFANTLLKCSHICKSAKLW